MGNSTVRMARAALGAALLSGTATAVAQEPVFEEIIVTAQKRAERIRDVPAAVSVISEEQLESLHATRLTDYAAYIPGVQVTSQGSPGKTSISLRGIAPISSSATIGTYIDETPLGSSGLFQRATEFSLDLLPYDVVRVEVLRGPQGTLYGAGSMGGLLKYVARAPDLSDFELRVGGGLSDVEGAGSEGSNVRASVNLPLVADRFALRASYARNELPGFIDGAVNPAQDINDGTQESSRVALLWRAGDAASLELTAMRQAIDTDNNTLVALNPVTLQPAFGDLRNGPFLDEPFEKEIDFYAATLRWDVGWADFTAATGYSDVVTDDRADATAVIRGLLGGLPVFSFFDLGLDLEKLTQELRLTSKSTGRFEWQIGAFYTEETAANSQIVRLLGPDGRTPFPGLDPLAVVAIPSDYQEAAVFLNGAYELTDRFKLGAGVRFASNDQDFSQIVSQGILLPIGASTGASDEDIFTWSLTPQWQLAKDAMLYGRIATGYQPGGPNVVLPNVPPTVDAATLTSYEVGLKSDFLERRVRFDVAAFYIDWRDIQLTVPTPDGLATFLINGGEAESRGVELSTAFSVTQALRFGLNAAYTDATVTRDVPSLGGRDGDRLPLIPELSWSATADYSFSLGGDWNGHIGAGFRWVDDRKTSLDSNPAAVTLERYDALDLSADVGNEHWTFRAYGRNVADERAYLVIGGGRAAPIQPRTWGLELDYRF